MDANTPQAGTGSGWAQNDTTMDSGADVIHAAINNNPHPEDYTQIRIYKDTVSNRHGR